jgi:hypothetical protein
MTFNQTDRLQIVIGDTFAIENRIYYLKVAQNVLEIIENLFPGQPPAGFKPLNFEISTRGYPEVITYKDRYLIYFSIASKELLYAKFAFQLGHELGHVMLGTMRSNGMVETLATLISHKVLDEMAKKWADSPPSQNWKDYAPAFTNYREVEMEIEHIGHFPLEVQKLVVNKNWSVLSDYMKTRREDQDKNYIDRNLNWLGTILLRTLDTRPMNRISSIWATIVNSY